LALNRNRARLTKLNWLPNFRSARIRSSPVIILNTLMSSTWAADRSPEAFSVLPYRLAVANRESDSWCSDTPVVLSGPAIAETIRRYVPFPVREGPKRNAAFVGVMEGSSMAATVSSRSSS
jgi:hypothetical protein